MDREHTGEPARVCLQPRLVGTLLCLASLLMVTAQAGRRQATPPVRFQEHLIGTMPGVYQCAVADMNGDGKPDILALSSGQNEIAWYENPTWKKHVITTATRRNIDIAAYDLNADGKIKVAVASEFDLGNTKDGGRLQWFGAGADANAEWAGHEFGALPTAHRLRWADWDGNGAKELVVVPILGVGAVPPAYAAPVSLVSYAFRKGEVAAHPIDHSLTVAHGMRILDFDGDGRDDLLVASYEGVTWFKPIGKGANRTWLKTRLASGEQSMPPKRGSSEVDRGWLKDKRPFLATIEPWHGNEVVVYTPPGNAKGAEQKPSGAQGVWERHVLDTTLEDGHALGCVDLDGDGQSEIVVGYRGGGHNL